MAEHVFEISLKFKGKKLEVFCSRKSELPMRIFRIVLVRTTSLLMISKVSEYKPLAETFSKRYLNGFMSALYENILRNIKSDQTTFEFDYAGPPDKFWSGPP